MRNFFKVFLVLLLFSFSIKSQTLVIGQANLAHGTGTDGNFNFSNQVTKLSTADVAAVQERTTGEIGWNSALISAGMSQAVYLENSPSQGDGPAIWYKTASLTLDQIYSHPLSSGFISFDGSTNVDKAVVAAKFTAQNGKIFYFVSVHLCWSKCADSNGSTFSAQRVSQATELLNWINSNLPGAGSTIDIIIGGDMNFGPDYPKSPSGLQKDIFTSAGYVDLWNIGISAGTATANWGDRDSNGIADMPVGDLTTRTHDTRRIDYFFSKATGISLVSISVPDFRASCPTSLTLTGSFKECPAVASDQLWDIPDDQGVRPSDHNFVFATLDISQTAPTTPTNLIATNGTGNDISLSWTDNSSNETSFKIERKLGLFGTYSQIGTASTNVTSYNDTSAKTANRPYIYRIRASNATGDSSYSNEEDATTPFTGTVNNYKTDAADYAQTPTTMPLPLAGGKFYDEAFGTQIMMFTGPGDGTGARGKCFGTNYSVWPTANKDNTKLFIYNSCDNNYWFGTLDPTTFSRVGSLTAVPTAPASIFAHYEAAVWSNLDADKLFMLVDAKIYYLRPSTGLYTLVKDLTSTFPAGSNFNQLYVSSDDNRFAALVKNNAADVGFFVYELSTNSVKLDVRTTDMNGITMDKSGNYVYYVPDTPFTEKIYNVNTGAVTNLVSDPITGAPDFAPGHNDSGTDLLVGNDQWHGAMNARTMSSPHTINVAWTYAPYWINNHVSLRQDDENWLLVSTYGDTGVSADPSKFREELFQVGVKSPVSGNLRRLLHNRAMWSSSILATVTNATNASPIVITTSTTNNLQTGQIVQVSGVGGNTAANGTRTITRIDSTHFSIDGSSGNGAYTSGGQAYMEAYWDSPRANISRDGKFIFFTSNWNGTVGAGQTQLFIANITPTSAGIVKKCNWHLNPTCNQ